ncbi:DinB superfamily protein [Abditibacterium utsteinense]|uniref:DinB superfamily protein n=1 Tax=Abditibacterium utsteinense TaxID=1960156 RepID=A0A2S8STL0_9BACT|nr:DinB family protein [Abditibacterium utsteinense]PQV64130.1 DinB superfamily protein [Abditibacterium utsteinense]
MDKTTNLHQEIIARAKSDFLQAKALLSQALASTPDERLNWAPSPTARTPIQLAAHAAGAIKSIHEMLDGRTFEANTTAEADQSFREWESQFTTREPVLTLLEENSAAYLQWLQNLTPEALDASIELPFGSGQAPLTTALTFAPSHTNSHTAQIDYIQTIYGDRVWH